MAAIYSRDVKKIFGESFFKQKWFLNSLSGIIQANKDLHVLGEKAKRNICDILFELRFNNDSLIDPDLYNELIAILNTTNSEFEEIFLCGLIKDRSFDNIEKSHLNSLISYNYNFDFLLELYEFDAMLIVFLTCPRDDFDKCMDYLTLNEACIYSIKYLINVIPNILNDEEILYRINKIVSTNKSHLRMNLKYREFKKNNSSLDKSIKKMIKNK